MTAAEEERLLPEGSESTPAQVSATTEEQPAASSEPQDTMSEAPTRPRQTSLESRPEPDSQPGAIRAFYGRTKDLAAGIFKEVTARSKLSRWVLSFEAVRNAYTHT